MEKIILFATDLDRNAGLEELLKIQFCREVALKDDEILRNSPIWYTPKNQGLIKNIIRLAVNANNRKPWEKLFFKNSFNSPLTPSKLGSTNLFLEG
jgi:hypothetical protein